MATSTSIPTPAARTIPSAPQKTGGPPEGVWPHYWLRQRVLAAIFAAPAHFTTTLDIEGVLATDLFTLNTPIGASIEQSFVDTLNNLREIWDPDGVYAGYKFVRQAQTFPDVLLKTDDPRLTFPNNVIMGIELKGWFTLAKEGEPSFRYKVSPGCCAPQDLLVIVPWVFKNVISGTPVLMKPIVAEAKFAAEMRNHWWEFIREARCTLDERGVTLSEHQGHYPTKKAKSSDIPIHDRGSNFGRIARVGAFDEEIDAALEAPGAGIPLKYWHKFILLFTDGASQESVEAGLESLREAIEARGNLSELQRQDLREAFVRVAACLGA